MSGKSFSIGREANVSGDSYREDFAATIWLRRSELGANCSWLLDLKSSNALIRSTASFITWSSTPCAWGSRYFIVQWVRAWNLTDHANTAAGEPLIAGGDEAGVKNTCSENKQCAFVTMMSGDAYLAGTLTLYYSVRKTGTNADFIVMCTRDGNSANTIASLQVKHVDFINSKLWPCCSLDVVLRSKPGS